MCTWHTFLLLQLSFIFALTLAIVPVPPPNTTRPTEYPLDKAKVRVFGDTNVNIFSVSGNCYKCLSEPIALGVLPYDETLLPPLDTKFSLVFDIRDVFNMSMYNLSVSLSEHGVYTLTVWNSSGDCVVGDGLFGVAVELTTDLPGDNPWIPVVVALAVLLGMFLIWALIHLILYQRRRRYMFLELLQPGSGLGSQKQSRLASLDFFRGLCICGMIFANYGGGGYWWFEHSDWNGLTLADLVFPWFMFIMGTAMALSMKSRGADFKVNRLRVWGRIALRSICLFGLGLFLNNGYTFRTWRIPGVLQYFAVSYLVVGSIALWIPKFVPASGSSIQDSGMGGPNNALRDVIPYCLEYAVVLGILSLQLLVTFLLPVPGCPTGYLGPGGRGDLGFYPNCTGGASTYVDSKIFGLKHFDQTPTCTGMYDCGPHDPESLLGALNAVVLCYLGLQAGRILLQYSGHGGRIVRWLLWGTLCGVLALGLCGAKQDGGVIPINKNLWSTTFVLSLAGMGFLVLTVSYVFLDILKIYNGSPFRFIGMNSITLYVASELLHRYFPFSFDIPAVTHSWLLFEELLALGCWTLVAYFLYWKRIFIAL